MDIKLPPSRAAFNTEASDNAPAQGPDKFRVPAALNVMAIAYGDLINHAYGLGQLTVVPGNSATLDADTVYALTFNNEDATATEQARLEILFDDIADIPHFVSYRHDGYIIAESMADLVLGYKAIADKKNICLDPVDLQMPASNDKFSRAAIRNIADNPYTLLFLHDVAQYPGRDHLAATYMRSAGADDTHLTCAYYSYAELERVAAEYDLKRDLHCRHVPQWMS